MPLLQYIQMSVFIGVSSLRHLRSLTLCLRCASDHSHTVNTLRTDDEIIIIISIYYYYLLFLKLFVILSP